SNQPGVDRQSLRNSHSLNLAREVFASFPLDSQARAPLLYSVRCFLASRGRRHRHVGDGADRNSKKLRIWGFWFGTPPQPPAPCRVALVAANTASTQREAHQERSELSMSTRPAR